MLSSLFRRLIYTKTVRSLIAKVPNPPSPYASSPVKLSDGSHMIHETAIKPTYKSCPKIACKAGRVLSESELHEAIQKRANNPQKWTISRLCARHNVSRSYVINRILSEDDRNAVRLKEQERIAQLSMNKKRGLVVHRLIRLNRFRSW